MLPAATAARLKQLAYYANGNDVDTVIVNVRVLMEKCQVKRVNEAGEALDRTGLRRLLAIPARFWGVSKGLPQ